MEILFEQDNEEKSVASLILDALVKVQKTSFYKILCVWAVAYLLQSRCKLIITGRNVYNKPQCKTKPSPTLIFF